MATHEITRPLALNVTALEIAQALQDIIVTLPVVDNLTTNDGSKALSAKMGKKLNDEKFPIANIASSLGQDVDKVPSNKVVDDAINAINSTLDGDSSATNATLNTTYVSSGSSSCRYYKRAGWCYVEMYGITFKSSLYAVGAVTGLPKSKLFTRASFNGADQSYSATINQKGDCCWIDPNGTSIYFFIDSDTYSLHHYTGFSYPLHEDEL